jgi:hypothetical protein
MFPGVISVSIIIAACFPRLLQMIVHDVLPLMGITLTFAERRALVLFAYAWLAGSMLVAYLGKIAEPRRFGRVLSAAFIYIAGYGPLLCACTFASYLKELRGADMTWEKTEKTGKVAMPV